MRRITRIFGRVEGAEIAEAALVLPLVFMFLLGIVWFGRAFNIYSTITQAAQRGVVTAARPTCATCSAPAGGWNNFPGDGAVENSVFSVMDASSLDRSQIISYVPSGLQPCPDPAPAKDCPHTTGNNITICRSVVLNPSNSQPAQCGTVVSFQYPFQFYLPFTSLSLRQIVMTAQAQTRMEN